MTILTRSRATAAVGVLTVSILTMGVSPAVAAAPANDTYDGRVRLTIPSTVVQDTSEARSGALEQTLNRHCGAPVMDASVWYRFRQPVDTVAVLDASASDYSAGILVASTYEGRRRVVTCNPDMVALDVAGGRWYDVVVFDWQNDGGGNGGTLVLNGYVPTRRATVTGTVDPKATFEAQTGGATVTGTMTCTGSTYWAGVDVTLTQRAGRLLVNGWGGRNLGCDNGTRTWTVTISDASGLFRGGEAEVVVTFSGGGTRNWSEDQVTGTVRLSR